jgi:hypothetical protein
MRTASVGALIATLLGGPTVGTPWELQRPVASGDEAARNVLRQARDALGGEAALDAVKGVRAVGRTSRVLGVLRISGEIDLRLALPDRYVRIDRLALGALSTEIATGFSGGALIQRASGPDGLRFDPSSLIPADTSAAAERAALAGVRQDAALLLLGFFCASFDLHPFRFTYAGAVESPDGEATALDIAGAGGFAARLYIDDRSHLPLLVSWMAPDPTGAAAAFASGTGAATSDPTVLLDQMAPVEHRVYFGDYRKVGGLRWPFRVRRSVDGRPSEEVSFDAFTINPPVDARVFDARR